MEIKKIYKKKCKVTAPLTAARQLVSAVSGYDNDDNCFNDDLF
jgi:hypothetical protein